MNKLSRSTFEMNEKNINSIDDLYICKTFFSLKGFSNILVVPLECFSEKKHILLLYKYIR